MTTQGGIVEYVSPGDHITVSAAGTIAGGQMVKLSANRTVVITAATAEAKVLGVALYNAVNGDTNLTVATDGVWPLTAAGSIAAGDDLVGAAAGAVAALAAAGTATLADINNARNIVGMALEAVTNTNTGRCKLMR